MKKLKSRVWKFFKVCKDDDKRAECTLCDHNMSSSVKKIIRGKTPRYFSTKPLWNHLEGKHPTIFKDAKNYLEQSVDEDDPSAASTSSSSNQSQGQRHVQSSLEETIEKENMWSLDDHRSMEISKIICEMMALDAEPFSLIEREGFTRLIRYLAPQYPVPSMTYFSQNLMPQIHDELRTTIKKKIENAAYISFTTDIWTATTNNESFISLTGHCLSSENMEREVFVLEAKHFPTSYTGYNIYEILTNALAEWDIPDEKIHIIVRDNATNMIAGTNLMVAEGIDCFIHLLQLVVHDAIFAQRSVVDILGKCRKIVTHFGHSSLASSMLKTIQDNLKLPTHKLIQDVSTRWNSTFYMLTRLHEQKQAVMAYAAEHDIPTLTAHQWNTVENIVRVLKPFEEMTKQASAEDETIGYVIPAVATLSSYLSKRQKDAGVRLVKQELLKSLQNRFLSSTGLNVQKSRYFVVATFLDPRYKARFLQDFTTTRKWMIDELVAASNKEMTDTGNKENQTPQHQPVEQSADIVADAHEDIWQCFDEIANIPQSEADSSGNENDSIDGNSFETSDVKLEWQPSDWSGNNVTAINAEIDKYMAESLLPRQESPLLWWRLHAKEYPKLKTLAVKYLSAPPSSVNSERLFSAAGRIYTENRNRLPPENAEMLLFVMKNIKIVNFVY